MLLNYIWIAFFVIAFCIALIQSFFFGNLTIWSEIMNSTFSSAKMGFEISLGLAGVLSLWLGLMKIGERGGVITFFSRLISPLFLKLFPEVPRNHPALGSIFMNMSANLLGLDNAATPLGLKAMKELQELNPEKERASNAMIMFLVINTTGLTIVPLSVMVYRAQLGAANPADVFLPILIATFCSTLAGILIVCIKQRINVFNKVLGCTLLSLVAFIGGTIALFSTLTEQEISLYSSFIANTILFSIIMSFIGTGIYKRINVYDAFIEGAKEGFSTAITIIPYLIAILVSIAVFRTSGALDYLLELFRTLFIYMGLDTGFVEALPTAFMKPLSGSGARGMMVDTINTYGADSFVGRVASVVQGSTDTTFYVLAVYFGSVGVRKTRYTAGIGLFADLVGISVAILAAYFFFG